jgi:hypothetical protein
MSWSPKMRLYRWFLPVLAVALAAMTACKSEASRLEEMYTAAGSGTGGRAAAGNSLRKEWAAGKVTMVEALNMAHTKLDSPGDAASIAFAGAVLDTVEIAQPDLESKTNELFWIQIGTLAGKAAAVAFTAGDIPLARSLVLSGSDRWQTDAYWREHESHDALAAIVLHKSGESKVALDRLRSRPELGEETQAAFDQIEREWRKSRGG